MADGFGEPLFNPLRAKVDVIFVDGFGNGHSHGAEASSTVEWPSELLNQTGRIARVFQFRYNATLDDFYPEPNHTGTSIDDHSAKLLQGLGTIAQTGDRPIIIVARDLGGLVCANALSQQDPNSTIANNIRGLAFFETPFEGKAPARWAKVARELPALDGLEMPSNLNERSWKLIGVSTEFRDFLEIRKELLRVKYFCETYPPRTPLYDDDLVEVTDGNWREITFQLAEWITEFGTPPAKREESQAGPGSIVVGDTHYHKELSHISGVVTGGIGSTSENGVRISGSRTIHYYGKDYRPRKDSSSPEPSPRHGY